MSALAREIDELIALNGPISIAQYMAMCLGHPRHGYYVTRDPLGAAGDFVTAPEISQVFGELIGLWCVDAWVRMGTPGRLVLAELGPGRGTLMADALRASRSVPGFKAAVDLHLVETSPVLRDLQKASLEGFGLRITWHETAASLPPGPSLIVANEFFDALPVRQFVKTPEGWHERVVGLDVSGRRSFGLSPDAVPGMRLDAPVGGVLEVGDAGHQLASDLAVRVRDEGGAVLVIDYGYERTGFGETLQAIQSHRPTDPLADPGEADLTAHVDFSVLSRAAISTGAAVHGPVPQGQFLVSLGALERARALARSAGPDLARAVVSGVERLVGPGPAGMGDLFKVLAITSPGLGPAGFQDGSKAGPGVPAQ